MTTTFTLRQVEAFRALMQRQTVTRAAQMLRVSQPAMSRLIADFEASAGLLLFERHQGRLFPTAEARVLYEEVERAFIGLDRIAQAADQIRTMHRGSLRIAGSPALALDLLPEVVAAFTQAFTGVEIVLLANNSRAVVELVAGQRIDLGFVVEAIPHPAVTLERLHEGAMPCILPPGHRLASRPMVHLEDLAKEVFVSFPLPSDARLAIDKVFADHAVVRQGSIEAQLTQTVIGLVQYGAGVALIDPVSAHYARGRVAVRPFAPVVMDSIYLATLGGQPMPILAAQFLGMMRSRLAKMLG